MLPHNATPADIDQLAELYKWTVKVGVGVTVIKDVAVLAPSAVFTVMVELPAVIPLTTPLASTVATAVLLEVQVTF